MNTDQATYCPEDNKLRLYVGRVPRDEYERLRAEGWTSTPKQDCDFVAVWTPNRRDTALEYAGIILDEDQGPEDRAADRAERFGGYRDKRTEEATGHADTYEGRQAFGFQSERRAERAAARHDRHAARACDAWGKAEYWQHRTAGVISHALHNSTPAVRMGRIKELEAEIRKAEKSRAEYATLYANWTDCGTCTDTAKRDARALYLAQFENGDYIHPRTGRKSYLYDHGAERGEENADLLDGAELSRLWLAKHGTPGEESDWLTHLRLRLAYEHQMLEAQGGRAAFVEMEVGGWIAGKQIRKVNKSNATGRVVSVVVKVPARQHGNATDKAYLRILKVERLAPDAYTPPTAEDKAALAAEIGAEKAAAPQKAPCPLINPSEEEAERLQAIWNERAAAKHAADKKTGRVYQDFERSAVLRLTQAQYSAASKGTYARVETRAVSADAQLHDRFTGMYSSETHARREKIGPAMCEIRRAPAAGNCYNSPDRVIVLTDKPGKAFPASVWPVLAVEAAPVPLATMAAAVVAAVVVVGEQQLAFF